MENEERILSGFVRYEIARGFRSSRKLKYIIRVFFRYVEMTGNTLTTINRRDAQNYQTHLATLCNPDGSIHYAPSTITNIISIVRNFYEYLKTKKMIISNPFNGIRLLKKENKLPRNIPVEKDLCGMLAGMQDFWKAGHLRQKRMLYRTHVIAELMYASGLRIDEVAGLRPEDIDFYGNTVTVQNGKGGRSRIGYLNEYASKVLRLYVEQMREAVNFKDKSPYLFGVKSGKVLDSALNRYLNRAGKKAGIGRFTSHNFRHCLGFHLLRRGCDMRFIQLILGHDDLKSTMIYTKVDKKDLRSELDRCHPRRKGIA